MRFNRYINVCTYTHTFFLNTHAPIPTFSHTHTHTRIHTNSRIHTRARDTPMLTFSHTRIHTHMRAARAHAHTHTYSDTHVRTHTHIHTQTQFYTHIHNLSHTYTFLRTPTTLSCESSLPASYNSHDALNIMTHTHTHFYISRQRRRQQPTSLPLNKPSHSHLAFTQYYHYQYYMAHIALKGMHILYRDAYKPIHTSIICICVRLYILSPRPHRRRATFDRCQVRGLVLRVVCSVVLVRVWWCCSCRVCV